MISEERRRQIQTEATKRADSLDNEGLRAEAVATHLRYREAQGDERDALEVADKIYTLEMVNRGMSAR